MQLLSWFLNFKPKKIRLSGFELQVDLFILKRYILIFLEFSFFCNANEKRTSHYDV